MSTVVTVHVIITELTLCCTATDEAKNQTGVAKYGYK